VVEIVNLPNFEDLELATVADVYSLPLRMSTNALFKKYVEDLEKAQHTYLNHINETNMILKKNLHHSYKLEKLLGVTDMSAVDTTPIEKAKDGSIKLSCLVPDCQTRTFKLIRHISDKHPTLKAHSKYLNSIARMIEKNRSVEAASVFGQEYECKSKKKNCHQNTKLINRKCNF